MIATRRPARKLARRDGLPARRARRTVPVFATIAMAGALLVAPGLAHAQATPNAESSTGGQDAPPPPQSALATAAHTAAPRAAVAAPSGATPHVESPAPPRVDDPSPPSNVVPLVLATVGLGAVVVGTVTGLLALEEKGYAEDHCSSTQQLCDATGVAANAQGRTLSAISAATLALGGLAVLGAFVLYQSEDERAVVTTRPTTAGALLHFETKW